MADEILLEPLKAYDTYYREKVKADAESYFDDLAEKAETDIELNRQTIKSLEKVKADRKSIAKKLSSQRGLKVFLIIAIVLFIIAAAVFIVLGVMKKLHLAIAISVGAALLVLAIVFIIIIVKALQKKIKSLKDAVAKKDLEIEKITTEARNQMASLCNLFDWNMQSKIISDLIDGIEIDKVFDGKKYELMVNGYGLKEKDENYSNLMVQSGSLLGNPFILSKAKVHRVIDKVYTGSITITWVETRTDSKGNSYTVTRSQTLTASVTHPAPEYVNETTLTFACNAAPDLSFSRSPQGMSGKSEKDIAKFVKNHEKELVKLREKSTSKGGNFTPLGNTTFESLFHAWNRDHEQQFRVLFTPLGQTNMTKILTAKTGFGDDFYFTKEKMINIISSKHSQMIDYSGDPSQFVSISFDESKKKFVDYVCVFFGGIYYDLIPILAIPVYQQYQSLEYIYGKDNPRNYSSFEHEVMANSFNVDAFAHPDTTTDVMLKTQMIRVDGKADKVMVKAYSYRGEPRTDYVTRVGGDGRSHTIPVHWTEYIPITRETTMEIKDTKTSRFDFISKMSDNYFSNFLQRYATEGRFSYQRGLLAILGAQNYDANEDSEIDKFFNNKNDNK